MCNCLQWMEDELTARLNSGPAIIHKNGPSRTNSHVVEAINRQETAQPQVNPTIKEKKNINATFVRELITLTCVPDFSR